MRGQVSVVHDDLKNMEAQVDQQAQHSRSNCLLFHGIKEKKDEDTNSIIIITVKEEMDIGILRGQVSVLHDDFKKMESQVDQQAQYSRRNCLLFHGIKEEKDEDTDCIIINTVKEHMDIEILPNDLDPSHRNGNPKIKKKERPIIVKFVRYNLRHNIFKDKKLLKGKGVSITESLSKDLMVKLNEARETYGFRSVWTSDGKIFFQR